MSSPRSVMALLVVLALSAKVTESAIAAPDLCTDADLDMSFCLNCKTKAKCSTVGSAPVPAGDCDIAGEACTVLAGIATCRPIAETSCSCDKASQCDAYDPDTVLICLSGGVTIINDCSLTDKTCVDGACDVPLSTTSTVSSGEVCVDAPDNSFAVIKPMCTTAAYCVGGESKGTIDCASGTYYDVAEATCMPVPPVPCAGCDTGACPDKSDCSKWYICEGGVVLDEETCDEALPDFDIDTSACVAADGGTCTGNDGCTFGLTTIIDTTTTGSDGGSTDDGGSTGAGSDSTGDGSDTTTSGTGSTGDSSTTTSRPAECTAANEGQRYPYEGNCKMYWSCVKVGNGNYDYVASTCLGEFVFNPATSFCDTQQNVPDCIPPL